MTAHFELSTSAVFIGVGATLLMDLWAAALRRVGIPSLDMALLGRWVGHLFGGRWRHATIAAAAAIPYESALGWTVHYTIGITFASLLVWTQGPAWVQSPTLGPPLLIGWVTVAAPLLILQPALGGGMAFRNTSAPLFNSAKSVVTHTVFGLGMYLSAHAVVALG